MEITDLLESFKFPKFSLAELNPKVDAITTLSLFGQYCMDNKIRFKDIKNRHNQNLHFISENTGRLVSLEICNNEIVERVKLKYDKFSDRYEPLSSESYELLFREERHPASV